MVLVSGVAWHTGQPPTCHHSTPDNQRPEVGVGQGCPVHACVCFSLRSEDTIVPFPLSLTQSKDEDAFTHTEKGPIDEPN